MGRGFFVNGNGSVAEEEEGDATEVNAQAEASIAAFRRQLMLDDSTIHGRKVKVEAPSSIGSRN